MNFRTLDLNLLRAFDVVMTERSVTRTAERLAMNQSAVSNALRRLRETTREELFTPTSSSVMPARQAEALCPSVRAALGELCEVFEPQGKRDARSERGDDHGGRGIGHRQREASGEFVQVEGSFGSRLCENAQSVLPHSSSGCSA